MVQPTSLVPPLDGTANTTSLGPGLDITATTTFLVQPLDGKAYFPSATARWNSLIP